MHLSFIPLLARYDVVIVGAGNAGLSAALVLGRARRRVLVLDGGSARSSFPFHSHGFFTREGAAPEEVLRIGREQLRPYDIELCGTEARQGWQTEAGIQLTTANGASVTAAALVLATGLTDELPAVPGLAALWGRGVYHCPYCQGWENRYNQVAVYGRGETGYRQALQLHQWSPRLTLCTDGPTHLLPAQHAHLAELGVAVLETPVKALDGTTRCLLALTFADGTRQPLDALFLTPAQRQRSDLAAQLGCVFTPDAPYVRTDEAGRTSVPGVYAVGDMTGAFQQAIWAAATGTRAAAALNDELIFRSAVAGCPT